MSVWTSPSGRTLVDFGQNLVGWLKITTRGQAGATITVRHAEVIEHDELGTRPLRSAAATDTFVCSGGADVFEPTLTFHGFRYAEITGLAEPVTAQNVVAVVVSSDLTRTGTFACSDDLVNQLHSNVVWSQRGNFLDLPTDCPQRDERQGWTGDIAVFAPTAAYLFDVEAFLADWMLDLAAETEHADGVVPLIVPNVLKLLENKPGWPSDTPTSIWGDAGCGCRGLSGRRTATARSWSSATRRWPCTCAPAPPAPPTAACGTPGSSSATGSTPPLRRRTRSRPWPTST